MADLRALTTFTINGVTYKPNQLFVCNDEVIVARLLAKKAAELVSIAPQTPITTPVTNG